MPTSSTIARGLLSDLAAHEILTRDDLLSTGMSSHSITAAVRRGTLIRIRRGLYAIAGTPSAIIDAVRIGGRLTCVTLLHAIGVFVQTSPALHVHVRPQLSRSRRRRPREATVHWGRCTREGLAHIVSLHDAVRQSVRCQGPREAIATLDSILQHRLLTVVQLERVFAELPTRFQVLLTLVDGSAESGPETYMRLILRSLGVPFETQVLIAGVGRVDFVVDGWLIIECDSRSHHEGWGKQVDDRRRDIAAARRGYVTIRPLASALFSDRAGVRADVAAILDALGPRVGRRRAPQLRRTGPAGPDSRRIAADLL
ncbi:type IV toxin-antitoxin system AbiEi family antitoxin domain-containing protein [Microbacterium sp. NPDC089695]|uniref:type IV toxin-antitoxin system AbiEi family antitoxin domain-containing protein n=1 Tax=Microbacterium sp. NPDC089695 TaxID=3364198 RepID=UPI0037FD11A6